MTSTLEQELRAAAERVPAGRWYDDPIVIRDTDTAFVVLANPTNILALLDRLELMREALKPFAEVADYYDPDEGDDHGIAWSHEFKIGSLRRARAALGAPHA